jgi:hypothetical protein
LPPCRGGAVHPVGAGDALARGESVTPTKQVEEEIAVLGEEWSEQLGVSMVHASRRVSPGGVTAPMIGQDRGEGPGSLGTVEQCPQLEASASNHNGVRPRCLCHDPATQRQAQTHCQQEGGSLSHLDSSNGLCYAAARSR